MALARVVIVNKTFPRVGLDLLKTKTNPEVIPYADYDPEFLPTVKETVKGCDAIVWNTKHQLTSEILNLAGPQLKAVTTMASGYDHIDVKEIVKRGIRFGNTPVSSAAVADIAVGLLISAGRRFKEGIRELENGEWKIGVQWRLGQDIAGSTVGIIGLGGIGQAVVRRLKGFDVARFIYCGNSDKPEAKILNVERVTREQLLRESDYVILSCPLSADTIHLINAKSLDTMKNTSVIVNIGRGELIDQEALYYALRDGKIFAAGLDVTTPEPLSKDHPLVSLPNCFILPHIGSTTIATRNTMATLSAKNILQAIEGKPMQYPIN